MTFRKLRPAGYYLFFLVLFVLFSHFILGAQQEASFPLPQSVEEAQKALSWKGWFTVAVFILTFIGLATEIRPPDITMLIGSGTLLIFGVLTPTEFLKGFSNDILMTIAMLFIIVRAMEVNGALEMLGNRVLTKSKRYFIQILSLCVPVSISSAFLNNTPIVLMMTPMVRQWAIKNKLSPSKFLIPLSYASLFGGACTLIGTSTNLIVYGLISTEVPEALFGFFELAYVGIPCAIAGTMFLATLGYYFLPNRVDPTTSVAAETREFTGEFTIGSDCPLVNKSIKDAGKRYFRRELLIQVERNNSLIDSPNPDLVLFVGDRLVFIGDIHQIAEIHAIQDLKSVADPHFQLDVSSSHFSEVVIPTTSHLVGKTLRQVNFRDQYGASVLAVYRQGWRVLGNVRDVTLQAGDTLMLLSGEPWRESFYTNDFHYIRLHEKLLVYHPWRAALVTISLIGVVVAAIQGVPLFVASFTAALILLLTKIITFKEAKNSISWDILLLIACSFALGKGMETTGVATYFAQIVLTVFGSDPYFLIGGLLLVSMIFTSLMTNNAAALIIFPIAFNVAKLAGYVSIDAIKAIGITVAVGASIAYAVPTGYQTHMIVYGPGGYRFMDFLKIGIVMNLIMWAIATAIIPRVWPIY